MTIEELAEAVTEAERNLRAACAAGEPTSAAVIALDEAAAAYEDAVQSAEQEANS